MYLTLEKLVSLSIIVWTGMTEAWVWECSQGFCNRIEDDAITNSTKYLSHSACRLVCGNQGIIWPKPSIFRIKKRELVQIDSRKISINIIAAPAVENLLRKMVVIFNKTLYKEHKLTQDSDSNLECDGYLYGLKINLNVFSDDLNLNWGTLEEYNISLTTADLSSVVANIDAPSIFGARHALESLQQLIVSYKLENATCVATLRNCQIYDRPVFKHRGLLLDTGRNYLSLTTIKQNIIAMAASKMNVLHWHLTDTQSFPFESIRLPNMTKYGAYSPLDVYTLNDIKSVKDFAFQRGVKIILEIDAPAHAGNGWQWTSEAGLGNLAVCVNQQPWRDFCIQPPCGQLNPANQNLYSVLNALYQDIVDIFPESDVFHMGGDEVDVDCWNSSKEIIDYLGNQNRSDDNVFLNLWSEFQNKSTSAYDYAIGHNQTQIILWTSDLTDPDVIEKYLSKDRYVIQSWTPKSSTIPYDLLKLGYKLVISTKDVWYLDRGFWSTTVYSKWTDVYQNFLPSHEGVLGGEICMWGELVDDSNILPRIWPRAAAAAERLWSDRPLSNDFVKNRFYLHTERLRNRGIATDVIMPKYCDQNEEMCLKYQT